MGNGSMGDEAAGPADRGVTGIPEALAEARRTIDNIDAALIHILAERFRCTPRVGHIKAVHDLPPADPEREARQVARVRALAVGSLPNCDGNWDFGTRGAPSPPPRLLREVVSGLTPGFL